MDVGIHNAQSREDQSVLAFFRDREPGAAFKQNNTYPQDGVGYVMTGIILRTFSILQKDYNS
jgi:hypothetical protein